MTEFNKENYYEALLGTRARRAIKHPNIDGYIDIRLLSSQELLEVNSAKRKYLKALDLENEQSADLVENSVQIIYRSILKPETNERFFSSVDEVRNLPTETLAFFLEQYENLSMENNIINKELSQEEVVELKKKLLNGGGVNGIGYMQLLSLCNHLADCLLTLEQPAKSPSDADQETSHQDNGSSTTQSTNQSEKSTKENQKSNEQEANQKEESSTIEEENQISQQSQKPVVQQI